MEVLSWHQIAARLLFVAGVACIWLVMGPVGFAGAGALFLILLFARELELKGRQKQTEQEHWQTSQSHAQPRD